jgi:MFS family permease
LLWTAQGSFISKNSTPETLGKSNGIFWALFQISAVAGNLTTAIVLSSGESTHILFIILSCVGGVAVLSFIFLRKPKHVGSAKEASFKDVLNLMMNSKMLWLLPILIFSGLSQSYFYAKLPATIKSIGSLNFETATNKNEGLEHVGWLMTSFGASNVLASFLLGRLSDKIGRKSVLSMGSFSMLTGLVICAVFSLLNKFTPNSNEWYLCFAILPFLGIADGAFNTQLFSIVGYLHADRVESAFAFMVLGCVCCVVLCVVSLLFLYLFQFFFF